MFGKLLKNDLKAQWHSVSVIYLTAAIVAVAAECAALFASNKMIAALAGFLVILALGFTSLVTLIAVALLYERTLFGRAGYLSLTLPVKTSSLVRSKTVSGLIWIFTAYGLLLGSIVLWIFQLQKLIGEEMTKNVEDLLSMFGVPSFMTLSVGIVCFCISFTAIILLVVQSLYLGITLSHISPLSKLGAFGAIVMFFVIFGVLQSVTGKISDITSLALVVNETTLRFTTEISAQTEIVSDGGMCIKLTGTLLRILIGILLHFPIVALFKKKVNVK